MKFPKPLAAFLFLFMIQQTSNAQVRIFGGPQLTSAKYLIHNAGQATEYKQSFMAGVSLQTHMEGPLYFVPTWYYSQKGYKVSFDRPSAPPDADARNNNTTINTVGFTPLLQFNLSKSKTHTFVRFGPGFDVAVSGTEVFDSTGGKRVARPMKFGSTAYSPVTIFSTVHLGLEHKSGLLLFAHYEHGLSNLNNADLGPMILHRVAGVAVGWRL